MKKGITALVLLILACSLLAVAGCGNKTTVQTPQGEATVENNNENGGSITVNEGGGSSTMEKMTNAPTEAELGASIYPGAEFDAENSGTVSSSNQEGQAYAGTAQFLTNDDFEKVVAFYQDKLGEPTARTSTSAGWWIGDVATGNYTAVQVEQGDGNVKINIARMSTSVK